MPDYIRVTAPRSDPEAAPLEYLVRASDIILITYDVSRDTTTVTLRDVGQLGVAEGPDEIEHLLTTPAVAPPTTHPVTP